MVSFKYIKYYSMSDHHNRDQRIKDNELQNLPQTDISLENENVSFTESGHLRARLQSRKMREYILIGLIVILSIIVISLLMRSPQTVQDTHDTNQYHRHDGVVFQYPTLGIPIPGNTYNAEKVALLDLRKFDDEIIRMLKPYNDTDCEFARYGDYNLQAGGDGGYVICKNFINKSEGIINIGINGFDEFGCRVSTEGKFANYQYDCTNPTQTSCETNRGLNKMHNICLGAVTENGPKHKFSSLEDIIKVNGLENKHIYLKFDCQGCEFSGLKYFPVEKLDYIDQISGEIHLYQIYQEEWGILDILRTLTEKFVMVNLHMTNFQCSHSPFRHLMATVFEFHMVNKKIITLKSQSQSYNVHPLNIPDYNGVADCQMSD